MKIVCISDTHGKHHELAPLPAGDMLIYAGDMTVRGTQDQIDNFLAWMAKLPYQYKILVAGNHDFALEQQPSSIVIPQGIHYLYNEMVELAGLKIWGSPVCTPYFNWAFMWQQKQRQELYRTIPDDVDIIINHGPALGVLDKTVKFNHAGCEFLRQRILEVKPKLSVCGHIHESYGQIELAGIVFVNAALLNRSYEIVNAPIVIEI